MTQRTFSRPRPLILVLSSIMSVTVFALAGCGPGGDDEDGDVNPADVMATVQVAHAEYATLANTLLTYGAVEFDPSAVRLVNARYEAIVAKVLVAKGESVQRGQPMLVLEPSADSRAARTRARSDLQFAIKERDRITQLREEQLATNADVATAEQALQNAQAAWDAVRSQMGEQRERTVTADSSGSVTSVDVEMGQMVTPGTALLRVASTAALRVRAGIELADLPGLNIGDPAAVQPLQNGVLAGDGNAIVGQLAHIYRQVDPATGLADAIVAFDAVDATSDTAKLVPGTPVQVKITRTGRGEVIVVPHAAVLFDNDQAYVFTVAGGVSQRRDVQLGNADPSAYEVRQGVSIGDQVVVLGNHELEDGMKVRVDASEAAATGVAQ